MWNDSPDIRLHCNFYFIRNLQFHIFPNGITLIIYISGNNLSINHSDSKQENTERIKMNAKVALLLEAHF